MSERKWLKSPTVAIATEYGPVEATFVDVGRASVRTNAHINDGAPCLVFRGTEYLAHVTLYAAEEWRTRPGDLASLQRRPQWTAAPRTHAEKMTAAIAEAVRAYVAQHPEVLRQAEAADANNTLIELATERATAAAALADIDRKIGEAEARLAWADA